MEMHNRVGWMDLLVETDLRCGLQAKDERGHSHGDVGCDQGILGARDLVQLAGSSGLKT